MDLSNYLQENLGYNNLEDFQKAQIQNYTDTLKELGGQYKEQAVGLLIPAVDLFSRAKNIYNKITQTGEKVGSEVENVGEKVGSEIENVGDTIQNDLSSSLRSIGDRFSKKLSENMFESDPEASIADSTDSMGIIERAQSFFRGGVSSIENVAGDIGKTAQNVAETAQNVIGDAVKSGSSFLEGAQNAVGDVAKTAEGVAGDVAKTAEGVAGSVAEEAGLGLADIVPGLGELAMVGVGIYDLVKGFKDSAPQVVQNSIDSIPTLQLGI